MANANAIVEKMAQVGLRHGEKAGVAIAMTVFLVCVAAAFQEKGTDTTPDQVKKAAEQAQQNLNRHEDREAIVKRLEEVDKIEPTDFVGAVEKQVQVKLVADQYRPARTWVTPEPGAGLIRDMPELIAPTEIYAYPGRGGLLVFALDDEGNKIPYKEGEEKEGPQQKYGKIRKKGRGGMGGSTMGGMMGGQKKKKHKKSKEDIAREEKEEKERLARNLSKSLAGEVPDAEPSEADKKDEEEGGPYKEITKGYRWVVITGVLDHGKLLENYRKALKNPAVAHPQYLRLDIQRRTQQSDGTWSEWTDVDIDKNYSVLDNITDEEEELVPENKLPENLVDHLPFLTAGLYSGAHVAKLVPKEKRQLPPETKNAMGMGMGGPAAMGMGSGSMAAMMQGNQQNMQNMMGNRPQMGSMMSSMQGSGGMGMGMGMGTGASESVGNFWKSEEQQVMIRALDYTVKEDETYRYRVRIVVANPNYNRDDVSPGVDRKSKTLSGPWSKESEMVSMPPDVQPYAVRSLPINPKTGPRVLFQVARFNPGDGWTIPARFDAGLGEIIGELDREAVPKSDGSGTKSEQIDFNSHQIVLDIDGGGMQNLPAGMRGPSLERPALAALLRHDGAMIVHSQADDLANQFRIDIESNYKHELDESNSKKKREHSQGGGFGGMMGSMMQNMMGGGRRGGGS